MTGNRNQFQPGRTAARTLLVALAIATGLLTGGVAHAAAPGTGTATVNTAPVIDWP